MEIKPMILTLFSIVALLGCFVYSYFVPTSALLMQMPFMVMVLACFICGIIFFGYLAFVPMILFGLQLGTEKNAAIFLYLAPMVIATYAGTKLGFALWEDFNKKRNFLKDWKTILVLIVIAVILAIAIEQVLPYILEFWPQNFMGLNVIKGQTTTGVLNEVTKLIKR